jgi:PAS domain S-box-containing protein
LHCEIFDAVKYISAAAGIRTFIKCSPKAITLRDALVFVLIAVVIVPFGTAFWGAGLTIFHHFGTHYWVEWRNLGISNAVTTIVLLPAILLGVHQLFARRVNATPARLLEAAFLGASLFTAGIFIFGKSPAGPDTSPSLLFAPIPLFIWAALRFGLGGVSASMLALTFEAIWGTMHGRGPFLMQSPADNALALQTFLLVMAVPLMFLAVVVEDERRSRNALRQSEKRLTLAATAGDLGLWLWNLQSNALWATERAKRMFGFTPESELTYETFYGRVHPEDRPAVDAGMAAAISGHANYDAEYRICLPDGAEKWIAARGEIAFEDGNDPVSMTGIVSDITARRRNTLELFRHRQELTHISRISVLGELSASLAHELNQPLTAILSNAQAAQRFMAVDCPDLNELQEILKDIISETVRSRDVILHLRQLVRKTDRQVARVELNEIILQVVKLLHSDIVSRNVSFKLDLAGNLPAVLGDGIQLQQVLLNLFLNAFDAMNESALAKADRQLVVRTALFGGDVRTSISDSGTGIAADKLQKIFEPFFTTKANGLGLGLSVCGTIIGAHGGKLWAANNPERGATFFFTIPVAQNSAT